MKVDFKSLKEILENFKNDYNLLIEARFCDDKINDLLAFNSAIDFSSAKVRKELLDKTFAYKFNNAMVCFIIDNYCKKSEKVTIYIVALYPVKTSKGTVYILIYRNNQETLNTICFTAHFFDRYQQRLANHKIKNRTDSMKHFLRMVTVMIKNTRLGRFNERSKFGFDITINLDNGICLGNYEDSVILINTFINTSNINDEQINKLNELYEYRKTLFPGK